MMRAWHAVSLAIAAAAVCAHAQVEGPAEPRTFIRTTLRLSDGDLSNVDRGRAVVRTLPPGNQREVITAGAIRIQAASPGFVARFRTLEGFKTSEFVRQIARFSEPPVPEDLAPLTLDEDDFDDLMACRLSDCGLRLTEADIRRVGELDWQAADARDRATALYASILFQHLLDYRSHGRARLPVYRDQEEPLALGEELGNMLSLPSPLNRAPDLLRYLETFPSGTLPSAESFFYWSKEAFGFKPVIGLYHVVMHTASDGSVYMVTTQIYASHYMDGQVSLSAVMPDADDGGEGFYWLYFNRARIGRLDSFMGRLSKSIVQRRTRNGLARSMNQTRERMEGGK
jgi:hypothetical protein